LKESLMHPEYPEQKCRLDAPIDFLAVGHVTHDRVDGKIRLGGAALYSALTAARMGKQVAVLTSYGDDFVGADTLDGIPAIVRPAQKTSTFKNTYTRNERIQRVYEMAEVLSPEALPPLWRTSRVVYLCPVLHEVPPEMVELFPESLVGVAPQGFFRTWNGQGRIRPCRWEGYERMLRRATMVIVSENDIAGNEDIIGDFRRLARIVIVTRAEKGARVFSGNTVLDLGAYPATECEPTGAGDCFGASFLVRYQETGDIEEAARFASCVGAFVVEKDGIQGIPTREDVLERMKSYALPVSRSKDRP
jgi:sugar/nucleoside kinase (ribokinase family)